VESLEGLFMIAIQNLSKSFNSNAKTIQILRELNLQTSQGQSISIVGKSGSGKSTLLSLMAGLDRPDAGNIVIDQLNLQQMTEQELTQFRAKVMGIVFQRFHLVDYLTALENVQLALDILGMQSDRSRAQNVLSMVGLGDRMDHFPKQLSGGECQRVAIARALVVGPKVLLADEPSGNLDQETGKQVMQMLFDLCSQLNTTLVLVTHDRDLAQKSDIVYELKLGKLEQIAK
jgi:putative ABC transport system ATP-binding protein